MAAGVPSWLLRHQLSFRQFVAIPAPRLSLKAWVAGQVMRGRGFREIRAVARLAGRRLYRDAELRQDIKRFRRAVEAQRSLREITSSDPIPHTAHVSGTFRVPIRYRYTVRGRGRDAATGRWRSVYLTTYEDVRLSPDDLADWFVQQLEDSPTQRGTGFTVFPGQIEVVLAERGEV